MLFKIKITEQYSNSGEPTESWVLPYTYDNLQLAIEFAEKLIIETHASEVYRLASEVYRLGLNVTFNIQGERGEILFTSRPYGAVDFYG